MDAVFPPTIASLSGTFYQIVAAPTADQTWAVNSGGTAWTLRTLAASAFTDATNASNISSGTLAAARVGDLSATYLTTAGNLAGVASASTARTNLGLGTAATVNTGTTSGTVPVRGTSGAIASSAFIGNSATTGIYGGTSSVTGACLELFNGVEFAMIAYGTNPHVYRHYISSAFRDDMRIYGSTGNVTIGNTTTDPAIRLGVIGEVGSVATSSTTLRKQGYDLAGWTVSTDASRRAYRDRFICDFNADRRTARDVTDGTLAWHLPTCNTAGPADADMPNSSCAIFDDGTNTKIKIKDGSGTVTTRTLA